MNYTKKKVIERIASQITALYVDTVEYDESRDEIYLNNDYGDAQKAVAKLSFNHYGIEQLIYDESVTLEVQAMILLSEIDEDYGKMYPNEMVDRLKYAITEIAKMF